MITITAAETADLESIMILESVGFEAAERWSRTSWASQLAGADLPTWLAREGREPIGVITVRLAAESADLDRIVVAPQARRQGVARRLIEVAQAASRSAGATEMILEVAVDNLAAGELYREVGFDPIMIRRDYYGPGRDAQVMKMIMAASTPAQVGSSR